MTAETEERPTTYVAGLPLLLVELEVARAERVSPSYVRIELAGRELAEFGVGAALFDQRIKIIFPNAAGTLPSFAEADESWWTTWIEIPEAERGSMRTYTIRDVVGTGTATRLVVDIVVHDEDDDSADRATERLDGAGNRWALQAAAGQRVVVLAPRRGHDFGGIEWGAGEAKRLLIAGDETAAPAIRGILRDLPASARGAAFVEVPRDADVYDDLVAPPGVAVCWLPRNGRARGEALHAGVLSHLGTTGGRIEVADDEIDPDLWETPIHSSSGEDLDAAGTAAEGYGDLYAWIAGESRVVTGLRRTLVNELGLERKQVAFMGYWREGVSMRS